MAEWTCALCDLPKSPRTARTGRAPLCDWCRYELRARGYGWCARCKTKKPAHRFGEKNDGTPRPYCKDCDAAATRARYARNAERERAQARRRYQKDVEAARAAIRARKAKRREHYNAQRRAAYAANPERERAAQRARYWKRRDVMLARDRAWKASHPERVREYRREYRARRLLRILRAA